MWLAIQRDQTICQRIELKEGEYLIGREAHCDIHLDAPEISRRHARLSMESGALSIKDLGSSNGTFLNDARVTSARFNSRDKLRIGGYDLVFENAGSRRFELPQFDFEKLKDFQVQRIHVYAALLCVVMMLVFSRQFRSPSKASAAVPALVASASEFPEEPQSMTVALELEKAGQTLTLQETDSIVQREAPEIVVKTPAPSKTSAKKVDTRKKVRSSSPKRTGQKADKKTTTRRRKKSTPAAKKTIKKPEAPKIQLTAEQQQQAKALYYQGYRLMAYRTEKAYLKAMTLFQEVQKVAPDSTYEFHRKATRKLDEIRMRL